jgi:hypothetical protein
VDLAEEEANSCNTKQVGINIGQEQASQKYHTSCLPEFEEKLEIANRIA